MKIPQAVLKKKAKERGAKVVEEERERKTSEKCTPSPKNRTPKKTLTNPRLSTKVYYVRKSKYRSWLSLLKKKNMYGTDAAKFHFETFYVDMIYPHRSI